MGLDRDDADAVCLDFDKACAHFARWVDRREGETRLEPYTPDKSRRPKRPVPVYRTLGALLGIERTAAERLSPEERAALDETVDALRHDPDALRAFLLGEDGGDDAGDSDESDDESAEMETAADEDGGAV